VLNAPHASDREEMSSESANSLTLIDNPESKEQKPTAANMVEQTNSSSGRESTWHSSAAADVDSRRVVIQQIVQLLEGCKPRAFANKQEKLVDLARRLEVALYKQAKTRDEYMNKDTLRHRVRELAKVSTQQQQQQLQPAPPKPPQASKPASNQKATIDVKPPATQSEQDQKLQILKQRQQRLLLLRHASKCPIPEGNCTITPHCAQMKTLWKHIGICKNPHCLVAHCVSSRYVLAHYHRCKKDDCPVCQPVKAITQRSVDKNGHPLRSGANLMQGRYHIAGGKNDIDPKFARTCISGTGPSLPLSMTNDAIVQHLSALKVEWLQHNALPVLRKLMVEKKYNKGAFNDPVDPLALNIPHYTSIISNPMDLGTIRKKLEDFKYTSLKDFVLDIELVFTNALKFNPPESEFHCRSLSLSIESKKQLAGLEVKMKSHGRKKGEKCPLCFEEADCTVCHLCERGCISFEPKALFCSGNPRDNCQSANGGRIARNANYYTGAGFSYVWCNDCFDKHKGDFVVASGQRFQKSLLVKKKNNELFAEPWVSCDVCDKWVHQVCALFNPRKNAANNGSYVCPTCLVSKRQIHDSKVKAPEVVASKGKGVTENNSSEPAAFMTGKHVPGVRDLEHSHLGMFLEKWVRERVDKFQQDERDNTSKIDLGDIGPDSSKFHVRVMSNCDEKCVVKQSVKQLMPEYPDHFDYRSRCILLYQELDGVDVLFFAMFVQEYGSECPPPNNRKIYIAYLDSVYYFRPRRMRTTIYHELLLAYLEYSRRNGFTSAYIWACPPPNNRDDYIIHCHPEDQKVQTPDRLKKWYHLMVRTGAANNIFTSSCPLFEEHFEGTGEKKPSSKSSKSSKKKNNKSIKKGKKGSKGEASNGPSEAFDEDNDEFNFNNLVDLAADDEECDDDDGEDNEPSTGTNADTAELNNNAFLPPGNGVNSGDDRMLPDDAERRKVAKLAKYGHLPYFEGDYWPQEAEELAKEREAKKKKALDTGRGQRKRRRNGEEETADDPAATTTSTSPQSTATPKENKDQMSELEIKEAREQLIQRLTSQLDAMKEDFLVVKMSFECTRCGKYLLRGRWECRHTSCLEDQGFNKSCPFALCNGCYKLEIQRPVEHQHGGGCVAPGEEGLPKSDEDEEAKNTGQDQVCVNVNEEEKKKEAEAKKKEEEKNKVKEEEANADPKKRVADSDDGGDSKRVKLEDGTNTTESEPRVKQEESEPKKEQIKEEVIKEQVKVEEPKDPAVVKAEEEKKEAEDKAKREANYEEWSRQDTLCLRPTFSPTENHLLHYVDEGAAIKTPDYDKIIKNDILQTRHAFLSLCTGNRYQFDQLRRAKHSTMMVLYHLHNPDAPAHLYICSLCQNDILAGKRYHCDICSSGDFDLCQACKDKVGETHEHVLTPIVVTRGVNTETSDAQRLQRVSELRRARQHSLALFKDALVHSSTCNDPNCREPPCPKMKNLLRHRQNCEIRVRGGCEICRRVLCLVQMHARECKTERCRVPHCEDLKHHLKQQQQNLLAKQSQTESSRGRGRGRGRGSNSGVTMVEGSGGIKLKIRATGPASSRGRAPASRGGRGGSNGPKK